MGIVVVAALAANAAASADRGDHGDLPANQFGRQRRQPIDLILRPAVFDRHILALDIAGSPSGPGEIRADGPRSLQAMWR